MEGARRKDAFIVVMGGTGSMALEGLVHMAALDMLMIDTLHVLIVEVDNGNGNLRRTRDTLDAYQAVCDTLRGETPFFGTRFMIYTWSPYTKGLSDRQSSLEAMLGDDNDALTLSKQLFTNEEMRHTIDVGFKGHPNLGVIFMDKLLKEDDRGEGFVINRFLDAYRQSKSGRILLIGSCFGGTGAACIPAVGKFLRNKLREKPGGEDCLGALVMLPTFDVLRPDDHDALDPDSALFKDKVKTVLADYLQHDFWLDGSNDPLYKQIYLLGAPERVIYPRYSTGASAQLNPANFYAWFACTAVKQFFFGAQGEDAGVYVVWQKDAPFGWSRFSAEVFPGLERKAAQMVQALIIYTTEIAGEIARFPRYAADGMLGHLVDSLSDNLERRAFQDALAEESKAFDAYALQFMDWIGQIATHAPKPSQEQARAEDEKFHGLHIRGEMRGDNKPYLESLLRQRFFRAPVLYKLAQLQQQSARKTPKDLTTADWIAGMLKPYMARYEGTPAYAFLNSITGNAFMNKPFASIAAFARESLQGADLEAGAVWQKLLTALLGAFKVY